MKSPWIHGESRPGRSHTMAVLRAGASQRCWLQSCDIKVQYEDNVDMAVCQNFVLLVNLKIAGKWMFIPLKIVLIGIDPYPHQ